jgi:hypothetical protein
VDFSLLNVIVCAPVLAGWLALCGPWYLARYLMRRRWRREGAEWARLTAEESELDADLDRTWTAEHERTRRHP